MKKENYNAVTPGLERRKRTGGGKTTSTADSFRAPSSLETSQSLETNKALDTSKSLNRISGDTSNELHSNGTMPPKMKKKNKSNSSSSPQNHQNTHQNNSSSNQQEQRWPSTLEQFVSRQFTESAALNDSNKLVFQQQIRFLIEKAEQEKKLFVNDWTRQKVPILSGNSALELVCDADLRAASSPDIVQTPKQKKSRTAPDYDSNERKRQRMNRFNTPEPETVSILPPRPNLTPRPNSGVNNSSIVNDSEHLAGPIVGRSTAIEKRYYRLTSEPDPALVRPQEYLQKAVKFLLGKLDSKPYSYIKDQFKSIRQDMTVQHLKNDFCLYVYETNARISIENNDLGEMNQCLTQLEYLFDTKVKRTTHWNRTELEFNCYRILYMLMVENHSEIFKLKYKLLKKTYMKEEELEILRFVELSFELHRSIITSNYFRFFKQAEQFKPFPLAYKLVKDFLMEKERIKTLNIINKSYRKLPIEFIRQQLNIDPQDFEQFVTKFKLNSFVGDNEFDCASARAYVNNLVANTNFKRIDIKGQV